MEMSKEIKKEKRQFKDTKLAAVIRNGIYSYWRFKKRYRKVIEKWKEKTLYMFLTATSFILISTVGFIFLRSIYRWFVLGEY